MTNRTTWNKQHEFTFWETFPTVVVVITEFKIPQRRRPRKRRLKVNLRFFNDYSNSFTLSNASEFFLNRIPKNHIHSRRFFTSSIKPEIMHFPLVVVQWRQRNVQKSVMHVQSYCFTYSTYCFFDDLVVVAFVASQSPYCLIVLIIVWSRDLGGLDE